MMKMAPDSPSPGSNPVPHTNRKHCMNGSKYIGYRLQVRDAGETGSSKTMCQIAELPLGDATMPLP